MGGGSWLALSLLRFLNSQKGVFGLNRSITAPTGGTSSGSHGDLLLLEVPLERTCSFVNTRSGCRHPKREVSFTPVASATIRNLTSETGSDAIMTLYFLFTAQRGGCPSVHNTKARRRHGSLVNVFLPYISGKMNLFSLNGRAVATLNRCSH